MARGRQRATRLFGRCRQVRCRPAPRHRHCTGRRARRAGTGVGRGVLRGAGAHAWPHRDDRDDGRVQGIAHAPRDVARPQRRNGRRRRPHRRTGPLRRGGARRPLPPSRYSGRRGRVRRPTRLASAAECPQPSAGTRGAARASSSARVVTAASCGAAGAAPGCACARARPTSAGSRGARAIARRARACRRDADGHPAWCHADARAGRHAPRQHTRCSRGGTAFSSNSRWLCGGGELAQPSQASLRRSGGGSTAYERAEHRGWHETDHGRAHRGTPCDSEPGTR